MSISQAMMVYELAKPLYNEVLRPLVFEAVKDSETEIDDFVLAVCDLIFKNEHREQSIKLLSELSQTLYKSLRILLIKAIGRNDSRVDDVIIQLCDLIFQYKE